MLLNVTIPKTLHLLCKEPAIPDIYQGYYNRMQVLHPDWTIRIYDDVDAVKIIAAHFSELLEDYQTFPKNIQRMDVFRVLAVYLYGGFYVDMDIHFLKPLDPLLKHQLVLGEEKTLRPSELHLLHHKHALRIANYMFGGVAGHPFLIDLARSAINNSRIEIKEENDILETTGPGLLTNYYHEHQHRYPDVQLLRNSTTACLKRCTPQPSCHFGDYAAHLHMGSWRWQHKIIL